jgi:hypothetical protein
VGWWLQEHVNDGRSHLNFDEYKSGPLFRQFRRLQEIESEVKEEQMPLPSYLPLHAEARLTGDQRARIIAWSQASRDSMQAWYPADSLQRRRRESPPTE